MLFIRLATTKTLTLKQEKSLQESVRALLSVLSHEQKEFMLHIEDNQLMYCHEEKDCLRIECQFIYHEELSCKKEFIRLFQQKIESITKIPVCDQSVMIYGYMMC